MALSKEVIVANPSLKALSDEQIESIVTLSINDETRVIGDRIGKLHGDYESDILAVSGLSKNAGEKAYDYNKRVIKHFKDKAESINTINSQLETLKGEKESLEKQIKEGKGSEVIAQKLRDVESERDLLKTQLEKEQRERKEFEDNSSKQLFNYKVSSEIDREVAKFTFKKDIAESILKVVIGEAKRNLLAENNPAYINVDGKEVLVYRDEKGEIKRDTANALSPFTTDTLLKGYLKDVIDTSEGGAGSGSNPARKITTTIANLGTAKTQVEANDIIDKHLLGLGLTRLSEEFTSEKSKLWKEYKIKSLPES